MDLNSPRCLVRPLAGCMRYVSIMPGHRGRDTGHKAHALCHLLPGLGIMVRPPIKCVLTQGGWPSSCVSTMPVHSWMLVTMHRQVRPHPHSYPMVFIYASEPLHMYLRRVDAHATLAARMAARSTAEQWVAHLAPTAKNTIATPHIYDRTYAN